MSRNSRKTVVMEKDGVQTEVTREQFKGLAKRGWTVVDDGNKSAEKANEEEAKEAKKLEEQELKLFGSDDEEK